MTGRAPKSVKEQSPLRKKAFSRSMVIVDEDKHDVDDQVNQSPPVHGDGGLPLLW